MIAKRHGKEKKKEVELPHKIKSLRGRCLSGFAGSIQDTDKATRYLLCPTDLFWFNFCCRLHFQMNRLLARAKNYNREKQKKKTDYTAGKTKRVCHGLSRSIYQVQNKKKWANGTLLERPQLLE